MKVFVYNETLVLIVCFAVWCGGCGILPSLFALFQNNLSALFCLKLMNASDEIPATVTARYCSCYLWRM